MSCSTRSRSASSSTSQSVNVGRSLARKATGPPSRGPADKNPALVRRRGYGFTADQAFEVGLPCGGEIDVFLEPGPTDDSPEADIASDGTVLLTVLDGPQIGRKLLVRPGVGAVGGNATPTLAEVADRVRDSGVLEWDGQRVFAEIFRLAPRLVIVGAIDIAEALAALASSIGWRTICVDPRAAFATRERVPSADELRIEWPDQALMTLNLNEETAVVVLLHDERFIVPTL